jgi:hypothetical protein
MGALPQVLEIIFEVQRKKSNEKINRKEKKSFSTHKFYFILFHFILFLLVRPLLFSNLITFFLFILNNLKRYKSATSSFINHLGTLIATERCMKNF